MVNPSEPNDGPPFDGPPFNARDLRGRARALIAQEVRELWKLWLRKQRLVEASKNVTSGKSRL